MVVHLYGVVSAQARLPDDLQGRQEAPVRRVSDGERDALISDVDPDRHAGRRDLLAHAHVLERCVEEATVVPFQFGIALEDDDAVRERVLTQQRAQLAHLLRVFQEHVQLTVQALHQEEPALREVLHRWPDLVAERDRLQRVGQAGDLAQVQLGQAVAAALEDLTIEDGAMMMERLAPLATAVGQPQALGDTEVLHAAFLVARSRRLDFDHAVGGLRDDYGHRMTIRYIGPQPPYSFVEPAMAGELSWA
ncbi:GvpL/GvpF family gas vesicle protein [Pedococcus sp. 5OH_020]|uniref:GvpL/GvpF family gas vesicle protein n=1 Tax=Pedococcus sp. 5OH_020 TaxID=2989814 RepID=UPI0022E9F012|nr:GvpL/GvpF family gas vesicle protein [Pedococcus sp. 5OH_020]